MTNNEIKAWAKENYKKYQWKVVGATIIVSILTSIAGIPEVEVKEEISNEQ